MAIYKQNLLDAVRCEWLRESAQLTITHTVLENAIDSVWQWIMLVEVF